VLEDCSRCVCCVVAVKGVNFYGPHSEYVVTGSDCGNVFLWDKRSADIVNYFHADDGGVVRSAGYCSSVGMRLNLSCMMCCSL